MENNLSELFSLFRFLNPSFFRSKARFSREYGKPIQEEKDDQVLTASFIRDCSSVEDIDHRISEFHRLIAQDPAPHWGELFSRAIEEASFKG